MAKNNPTTDIDKAIANNKPKSKKIALKIFLLFLMIILALVVGLAAGIIKSKWIK